MDQATYVNRLEELGDDDFLTEVFEQVDGANQFPFYTDWDERARLCFAEAQRRQRPDLYDRGFNAALAKAKGDRQYLRAMEELGTVLKAIRPLPAL